MIKSVVILLLTFFVGFNSYSIYYSSNDIPQPKFDGTHIIFNPDGILSHSTTENIKKRIDEVYRDYGIEVVVISVNYIKGSGIKFLDELGAKWDINKKTKGKYLIQLRANNIKEYYAFSMGSNIYDLITDDFLDDAYYEIEPNIKYDKIGFVDYDYLDKVLTEVTNNLDAQEVNEMAMSASNSDPNSIVEGYLSNIDYNNLSYQTAGDIYSVSDVPNQRTINDLWVSNPHQILSKQEADKIDQKLKEINSKTGYEVAVVVLNSINNGQSPFDFGLELFNAWGIGQKGKENGLLIMVVLNPHNLTFVTGSGTEMVLSDALTNQIGDNDMRPSFRNEQYAEGILKGLETIQSVFEGNSNPYEGSSQYSNNNDYAYTPTPWYKSEIFLIYATIVGVFFGIYLLILLLSILFVKDLHSRYHIIKFFNLLIFPIIFPIPFALLYFLNKKLMDRWRNTIRFSKKTGEIMHKLNEEEEDEYLTQGQITEETVKSIDYDVWVTQNHDDILILRYADWFNKYHKCPKCGYKTYFKEYDKTIVSATYSSSGTGEKKYYCENCGHSKITRYIIPKLQRSSSSSGGYSSGGSSWSGGGGSSWGGGSSSGGGSSGGW